MKNSVKISLRVVSVLAIVTVIVFGIAALLGYVRIDIRQPGQVAKNSDAVCDSQDIQAYNKFVTMFTANDQEQKDKAAQMQAQLDTLKKKRGFAEDPSCVFIEYAAAIVGNNAEVAEQKYAALEAFSKKGLYPSNEILDIVSLNSMKDRIEALKNADKEKNDPRGSG